MAIRKPLVLGPTGKQELAAGDTLPGTGSATLAFAGGAVVTAGTYPLDIPYAATLSTLKYEVGSAGGSFTLAGTNAGAAVTGLSALSVTSATAATATATAGNSVASGGRVAFVISSVVGSPTNAVLTLTWQRA